MPLASLSELIESLAAYPDETEWIEFKENDSDSRRIAADISALANSARYHGHDYAYKVWGLKDGTHELVGTTFRPLSKVVSGNQLLEIWLKTVLSRNALYEFLEEDIDDIHFVVLKISAPTEHPVYYDKDAFIREGNSTTRLEPGSAKERELWRRLQMAGFITQPAEVDVHEEMISNLLDVGAFYELLGLRAPSGSSALLSPLIEQGLIQKQDNGRFTITNLGALLVGKKLSVFQGLRHRALRVVRFEGKGSFGILGDKSFDQGYALALRPAEELVMNSIPSSEELVGVFRRIQYAAPQKAIRELMANMVMHQDLSDSTSSPLVRVYSNRIEFSNPGSSLIASERLLNAPPKTRNVDLVNLMRQMDLCEEGGTGWDIVISECEKMHLPSPRFTSGEDGTTVALYFGRSYKQMTKAERREAAYWHSCLLYEQGESMNNQSLRERFGLESTNSNTVAMSRLIKECCENGLIKEEDGEASNKFKRYIPAWA